MGRPCAPRNSRIVLTLRPGIAFAVVMALLTPTARGTWAIVPHEVPVDRLLKNANRHIQEHPKEAQGYYVLGRLHSMAFATGAAKLQVVRSDVLKKREEDPDALPRFLPWESILVRRTDRPTTPALRDHLRESIRNYRKATELGPHHALAWLGLGWVLEEASTLAEPFGTPDEGLSEPLGEGTRARIQGLLNRLGSDRLADREAATEALTREFPAALSILGEAARRAEPAERARIAKLCTRYWQDKALVADRRALKLSLEKDRQHPVWGPGANALISVDAAQAIYRVFGRRVLTDDERAELGRIHEQTKGLPQGPAITPLIFSMVAAQPLENLLDETRRVRFDLAGDERPANWPWLRPATALLVWDPAGNGRITSGRQLFGSATWWVCWQHGYEPLALLDDDGDGWVAGSELAGLAIWRDRNGDGRSDPGEVISAARAGIAGLAARPDGRYGGIPWNPYGLATTDGRLLPTYDWTPTPVSPSGPERSPRIERIPPTGVPISRHGPYPPAGLGRSGE
jgi:hypothetical protein